MYCLAALLTFISLAESRPFQVDIGVRPSISFDPYLIGSVDAAPGEFPWQLSMLRGGSHSCGASLLSPISALTVAHCVDGALVSSIDVIAGLYKRSDLTGTQTSAAASFTIHPQYDSGAGTFANDIAIITLATVIDTSPSHIELMTLPPDNSEQFVGVTCTVSGWGRTSTGNIPNTLQKIDIPVISTDECNRLMIGVIGAECTDNQIPLYDYAEEKGACSGDGGSPISCPLEGQTVIAGMISFIISGGGGQCMTSYPIIGTRTGVYLQWILDNTP